MKRKHTYMTSNCGENRSNPHAQRFDRMCKQFFDVAEVAAELEDKCVIVMNALDEVMGRVSKVDSICASSQLPREASTSKTSLGESRVLSPIAIRSKGQPPFERKV